jgi:hypothetical protein
VLLFAGSRLRRRSRAGHPQHGTSETSADEAAAIRADLDISVAEAHLGAAMSALGTPPVVITSDVQTCDASPST